MLYDYVWNFCDSFRIETGKASWNRDLSVDKPDYGNIVDMSFFDTGVQSVLSYATVNGFLVGPDLRTNKEVWKLRNDPKAGIKQLTYCGV